MLLTENFIASKVFEDSIYRILEISEGVIDEDEDGAVYGLNKENFIENLKEYLLKLIK